MSSYGYGGRSLKDGAYSNAPPSIEPLLKLTPYLWPPGRPDLKWRVGISMVFLVLSPIVTVISPYFFGLAVDRLQGRPEDIAIAVPLALIAAYGIARILMQALAQLRDGVFAKVCYHALRVLAVQTFHHLHAMSLRFHLERRTGGLSRVIDRGTKAIDRLMTLAIFNIFPTVLQLIFICALMLWRLNIWFVVATSVMIAAYMQFTFMVTRWRMHIRRAMNDSDNEANNKAVDSLLNYETVKYFNAEAHEEARFDASMEKYSQASIITQTSLSVLNTGQGVIASLGLIAVMALAAIGVKNGSLTVGDLVMANGLLIQLFIPLNLLGTVYRDISQGLIDMENMFALLSRPEEVQDRPGAMPLQVTKGEICFNDVVFAYDPDRTILKGISFKVPAGKTVAVVGPTGAGKSTISRILYRFYDIASGSVTIDGQDIRSVTQNSLRAAIGIVPQDTVLFNDTIRYNIAYGRIGAREDEILEAARLAQIDRIIRELPAGFDSMVGERGLKLSGGEKQRVAIARTLLKDPPILLLDEATSALDTHTEREIQSALKLVSANRTALVIAHRLSTIIDADEILVLDKGRIVERGRHGDLVARGGAYAAMWNRQKEAAEVRERLQEVEGDPENLRGLRAEPVPRFAGAAE
ncbi:MAG TPA: ABC transporter ATP-binding protein/permease [Micropepsaceae bacterium]|nr:ABC transporter ATP-binding protein/permease [Micropepsaceae bacterium]